LARFQFIEEHNERTVISDGRTVSSACPPDDFQSAFAWYIIPRDTVNNVPRMTVKNGGIAGFGTGLWMMKDEDLAVVVFSNNGESNGETIARNILYALYYNLIL
jgi:CubicO group peptidase (beta-lactamase class C family)